MRAAVMSEYGDASVLVSGEVPDPVPDAEWAVVRLNAAALNWHDVLVRRGQYGSALPHVPGSDGAGVDIETGDEVVINPSLWWGDDESAPGARWEILGDHTHGTHAQMVRVPRESLAPKPSGYSWEQAAALPLVGLTTFRALVSRGRLRRGESLLVLGAGGGVATTAVSMATALGCHVVVTSSSDDKIARSQALGAAAGVRYDDPAWPALAKALTPGERGFDLVLDSVGTWQESIQTLRPGGRAVVLGASRSEQPTIAARPFYFGQYDLLGTTMGSPRDFAGLLSLVEQQGMAPPVVDRVFALGDVADAYRHVESGSAFGKVVLSTR